MSSCTGASLCFSRWHTRVPDLKHLTCSRRSTQQLVTTRRIAAQTCNIGTNTVQTRIRSWTPSDRRWTSQEKATNTDMEHLARLKRSVTASTLRWSPSWKAFFGRQLSAASRKTTMTGFSSSRRTWAKSTKNFNVKMWEMDAEMGTVDGIGCPRQDGDADGLSSSFIGVANDAPNGFNPIGVWWCSSSDGEVGGATPITWGWYKDRARWCDRNKKMSRNFFLNDLWSGVTDVSERTSWNSWPFAETQRITSRCREMCHTNPQTNNTWMRNLLEPPWRRKDGQRKRRRRLVFALEGTLERLLADWVADGQKASGISCSMNCMCVLRASIVDVNDAEISAYFHDVSVTIQHALEKTQDHANDERPTRKVVFEEPPRSSSVSQWTSKMKCWQRMGSCTHATGEEACPLIAKIRERGASNRTSMKNEPKGSREESTTTTSFKILGMADRNPRCNTWATQVKLRCRSSWTEGPQSALRRSAVGASFIGHLPHEPWWQSTTVAHIGSLGFHTAQSLALPAFSSSPIVSRSPVSIVVGVVLLGPVRPARRHHAPVSRSHGQRAGQSDTLGHG